MFTQIIKIGTFGHAKKTNIQVHRKERDNSKAFVPKNRFVTELFNLYKALGDGCNIYDVYLKSVKISTLAFLQENKNYN